MCVLVCVRRIECREKEREMGERWKEMRDERHSLWVNGKSWWEKHFRANDCKIKFTTNLKSANQMHIYLFNLIPISMPCGSDSCGQAIPHSTQSRRTFAARNILCTNKQKHRATHNLPSTRKHAPCLPLHTHSQRFVNLSLLWLFSWSMAFIANGFCFFFFFY